MSDAGTAASIPEARKALESLLGKTVRVKAHSSSWEVGPREFIGKLWCTDRDANIILSEASETSAFELTSPDGSIRETKQHSRILGLVLILSHLITQFEVEDTL